MDCEIRARSISSFSCGWISCIFIACFDALTLNGRRIKRNPSATSDQSQTTDEPPAIAPHHGIPRELIQEIKETTQVEGFPIREESE